MQDLLMLLCSVSRCIFSLLCSALLCALNLEPKNNANREILDAALSEATVFLNDANRIDDYRREVVGMDEKLERYVYTVRDKRFQACTYGVNVQC